MDKPCPTNCVPVWFPGDNADHKLCEITNASPALALASVLTIIQEVNEHKIHYHVRYEDGVLLTEYLADPKSKTGERRLGRDEVIHLHGVYVDLETAKELITTVKSHQHGAE